MEPVVEALRHRLAQAADPGRAPAMQAYMKSAMPFLGIGAPALRALCRGVLDASPVLDEAAWRRAVLDLWDDASYREERYAAIQLTGHRAYSAFQQPWALELYEHLVVTGAWWDLVDPVATSRVGPIMLAHRDEVTPVIRAWAVDEDLWLRRTAIICQLHHQGRTDQALLREVVEQNLQGSRHGSQFFVRKAIGWALREQAKTDPDWVLALVEGHRDQLSGLSRREALKHLRPPT